MTLTPRAASRRLFLALLASAPPAAAYGRLPVGGRLRVAVPWPVSRLDPHDLHDAAAALFGHAVFEPVFALDSRGQPYPTLARELPQRSGAGVRVRLRPELVSARGKPLDGRALAFSLDRARIRGGAGILADLPRPRPAADDPLAVDFRRADATHVARVLASPMAAIVPRGFDPGRPDGSGAFAATIHRDRLELRRNDRAARGPALLDVVEIRASATLPGALRAFEANDSDIGWLGAYLHRGRRGVARFDGGAFAWVVLQAGEQARSWGAPGAPQQLVDGLGQARLGHLALHGVPRTAHGSPLWAGPAGDLLVRNDSPHLVEVTRQLAATMSQRDHELTPRLVSPRTITARRRDRRFLLMVDIVRSDLNNAVASLLTASSPASARRPPRLRHHDPRVIARTLPLAVVGALHAEGAVARGFSGLDRWDLPWVFRQAR